MGSEEERAVEQLVEIETSATSAGSAMITGSPSPEETPEAPATATSPVPASPESPVSQSVSMAEVGPATPRLPGMEQAARNPYDEAQLLSEQARAMFESGDGAVAWLDDYFALQVDGWSWRQAVYIIWASQPKATRVPGTESELAVQVLGLASSRAIRVWKQENPQLELRIHKQQMLELGRNRAEVLAALGESAATPSYRNYRDRELYLKIHGIYKPTERVEVGLLSGEELEEMSAEELAALASVPVDSVERAT